MRKSGVQSERKFRHPEIASINSHLRAERMTIRSNGFCYALDCIQLLL